MQLIKQLALALILILILQLIVMVWYGDHVTVRPLKSGNREMRNEGGEIRCMIIMLSVRCSGGAGPVVLCMC